MEKIKNKKIMKKRNKLFIYKIKICKQKGENHN